MPHEYETKLQDKMVVIVNVQPRVYVPPRYDFLLNSMQILPITNIFQIFQNQTHNRSWSFNLKRRQIDFKHMHHFFPFNLYSIKLYNDFFIKCKKITTFNFYTKYSRDRNNKMRWRTSIRHQEDKIQKRYEQRNDVQTRHNWTWNKYLEIPKPQHPPIAS